MNDILTMVRRLAGATLVACLPALAFGGAAFGQGPGPGGPGGPGPNPHGPPPPMLEHMLERHAAELGLSDEVRTQIRDIAGTARAAAQPDIDKLRQLHDQMRSMLEQDQPDENAVMQQADLIGAAQTELQKQRLRTMLKIRALLTPDQRKKLAALHEQRMKNFPALRRRWGRGMGMGGGMGMGPPDGGPEGGAPPPPQDQE
jgi:periplasmic protein CpxP/Spy